ncbi:MAG: segregation/condensation protein A [Lachnospiraceae bacterium]|nr:segregation/condensation protein A [Lachnospiraceae bacterium]
MSLPIKLEAFEGPLDLLLHLIDKNKVNIYDIPIVEITDQYMEYVAAMDRTDLNLISDFLVMAATLLDIKSRMLLPIEEEEEEDGDPRQELVERLLEYKMYKYISGELRELESEASQHMYREGSVPKEVAEYEPPVSLDELLDGLTLTRLNEIFQSVMRRQTDKIDPIRSKFGKIEREKFRVSDKIRHILTFSAGHTKFSFRNLLQEQATRTEVVVTFLAVLELIKMGHIHLTQETIHDDIIIEPVDMELTEEQEKELEAALDA